jgi:chain length determinant protein tyrosine kinase EpsG
MANIQLEPKINPQDGPTVDYQGRPMGTILVDEGRLRLEDADRILKLQRKRGVSFGEAAKQLRVLSEDDIQYALARQFDYPYLIPGQSKLQGELVAAYTPFAPVVENLRATRSQLMLRWFGVSAAQRAIAIVSANRGEGRSWVAANLAIVFSQLGERTLLIDGDLRQSRQHLLFGVSNKIGLTTLLAGRSAAESIQRIPDLRELSVLPAGADAPNPQELLMRSAFGTFLQEMRSKYDVILIDTPAASEYADAHTLAVRAGAALIVACDRHSQVSRLRRMTDDMREAGAQIVGSLIRKQ